MIHFDSENGPLRPSKIIKFHWFYNSFQLFAVFKIRSIFGPILVPTWLHFGRILGVLGASGRLLGRLGNVLGPSWGVLERLGPSWGVMWVSWERLGGILCPMFSPTAVIFRHAILDAILKLICGGSRGIEKLFYSVKSSGP